MEEVQQTSTTYTMLPYRTIAFLIVSFLIGIALGFIGGLKYSRNSEVVKITPTIMPTTPYPIPTEFQEISPLPTKVIYERDRDSNTTNQGKKCTTTDDCSGLECQDGYCIGLDYNMEQTTNSQ